ncbi:hypothetical protein [Streptacidiphilus carbonis]|uniref:hypothetical protein n=1 Tax=Streptacidiphilus carbonis TaxID=105422 RepID=UPI0005AAA508|nr:hypothetical protein [Streptacidiphilus carbonis]
MNHHDNPTDRLLTEAQQEAEAIRLIAEGYSDNAPVATFYRDVSPVPAIGHTPPVQQIGRAPMSQRATDLSGVMLSAGLASVPISGGVSLVLWTVGQINPEVVGMICVAPVAALYALSRVLKGAKEVVEAAPPVIHQHYQGTVIQDHREVTTHTRGVIARTNNRFDQ